MVAFKSRKSEWIMPQSSGRDFREHSQFLVYVFTGWITFCFSYTQTNARRYFELINSSKNDFVRHLPRFLLLFFSLFFFFFFKSFECNKYRPVFYNWRRILTGWEFRCYRTLLINGSRTSTVQADKWRSKRIYNKNDEVYADGVDAYECMCVSVFSLYSVYDL